MRMKGNRPRPLPAILASLAGCLIVSGSAWAQITLDGTLGPKGALHGPNFTIGANLGQQVGANLFQSFGQFNLHTNESATFTGPNSVENVIGRVTGGSASLIDGRLSCDIPNANLYLINPSGVMFGPNASLDVHGSFAVSSADYVTLADGGRFDAQQPANSVLTSAPPAAFGFLSQQPAPLSIDHSTLAVPDGRTVSLIGGDFTMTGGSVSAPSGRINVASVAAPGEVIPEVPGQPPALDVGSISKFGNIATSGGAQISTSGEGGGTIVIRGGRFEMQDASQVTAITKGAVDGGGIHIQVDTLTLKDGSRADSSTKGTGRGGTLSVEAHDSVSISGEDDQANDSGIFSNTRGSDETAGDAGAITVNAGSLTLAAGGTIGSSSTGVGKAGDVTVNVTGPAMIKGEDSQHTDSGIFSTASGSGDTAGDGGTVTVTATSLTLQAGGTINSSSFGVGKAGDVTVEATGAVTLTGEDSAGNDSRIVSRANGSGDAAGDAGGVMVNAGSVTLSGGGTINGSSFGVGKGGDVTVSVTGALTITGEDSEHTDSGIFSTASGSGNTAGDGGTVVVDADSLTLQAGGTISSSSFGVGKAGDVTVKATGAVTLAGEDSAGSDSRIVSRANGSGDTAGDAGPVTVSAGSLKLQAGGTINSNSSGVGMGGDVTINVAASAMISGEDSQHNNSGIFSSAHGLEDTAGSAGVVTVNAEALTLSSGGTIASSTSGPGRGGSVTVAVANTCEIDGIGTGVFSTAQGTGDAGVASIQAGRLLLDHGGTIAAQSSAGGRGGDVEVNAGTVRLTDGASINARSTGAGDAGRVAVTVSDAITMRQASITASAAQAFGGSITLAAGSLLDLESSSVSTSVRSGSGDGGNLVMHAPSLALNHSRVVAQADVGNGGNIAITADAFVASPDSAVSATSKKGVSGSVAINSPETNIAGALAVLPQTFLQADALLTQRCAARAGRRSSFVVTGRETLPMEPDGLGAGTCSSRGACP